MVSTMTAKATLSVPEAAALLGVTRNTAYAEIANNGTLAGVPAIRVGERRIVIPRATFEQLLGITTTENPDDATPDS